MSKTKVEPIKLTKETKNPPADFAWVERAPITEIDLRCLWHTRLIVEGTKTITGNRYVFEPGGIGPVDARDMEALLNLIHYQLPCCGNQMTLEPLRYFELVG